MILNEIKDKIQKESQVLWEKKNHKGLIALCTGAGKSKIAVNIVSDEKHKGKWLLIVPTEKLRDEGWKEEFDKWGKSKYYSNLHRECYASLHKVDLSHYDGIILDEGHNITEANTEPFFKLDSKKYNKLKVLVLTATPPKEDEKIDILKKLNIEIVKSLSLDEGVKLGIVAPYELIVVQTQLDSSKKNIETGTKLKKWKTTEFDAYEYKSKMIRKMQFSGKPVPKFLYLDRMRFVYNLPSKTEAAKLILNKLDKNLKTIIFAGSILQAEELEKKTFHSKSGSKDLDDFKKNKINRLSCVEALNEGENIHDLDIGLIVQLNSNPRDLIQRIGRLVRIREGHKAKIYIVICMGTQDEKWLEKAMENFDKNNITFTSIKNFE